jgi:hypothetical protein
MTTANQSSKQAWAFETVPGTNEIVAVDTTTYEFGGYNEEAKKWNFAYTENPVQAYYRYASRTPQLTKLTREFPTFKIVYNPFTAQHLNWILKNYADSDPDVDITTLDSGLTYPLSIRFEELEGTTPANITAVGCYCVGCYVKIEKGTEALVESEFAWQSIEDIGDNPNLTTAPSAPGGASLAYRGTPQVIWDQGGDNHALTEVWKAEFHVRQTWKPTPNTAGTAQTVYIYEYEPIDIILNAIFDENTYWDDYMDRQEEDLRIKVYKPNATNHVIYDFVNAHPISFKKTGERYKGHFNSICVLRAEEMTGFTDWETETGLSTFTTHWKGVVS